MILRLDHFGPSGGLQLAANPIGYSLPAAAVGIVRGQPYWSAVFEAYRRDDMAEAHRLSESFGAGEIGQYLLAIRFIDAEWQAGQHSDIFRANDWLEVEATRGESGIPVHRLAEVAAAALATVYGTFRLDPFPATLVSVLSREADPPAPADSYGYVSAKEPYVKLCVPAGGAESEDGFSAMVSSLGALHAAESLSGGNACPWLIEASRTMAGSATPPNVAAYFCSGQMKWLPPEMLDRSIRSLEPERYSTAVAQCVLIGALLLRMGGPEKLRACLARHTASDTLTAVQHGLTRVVYGSVTEAAIRSLYEATTERLFEQALADACA